MVVTGGGGFIGSHLAEALVEGGAQVTVADEFRHGSGNLARVDGRVRLVQTSLGEDELPAIFEDVDLVFHCAGSAYVPPSVARPELDCQINLEVPLRLLEWLRRNSRETAIVLFSSAAVYGNPCRLPMDEDHPLQPLSPYGVSKLAADRYGAVFARLFDMRVASLRCFAVYGPRQRKQVVFDLITRMWAGRGHVDVLGDGTQVRDFVFVDDVVRAAIAVATRGPMRGEAWNVGTGRGVSIRELVMGIGDALGIGARPRFSGAVRPGDAQAFIADNSRLRRLAWEPTIDLSRGLARTVAWLRNGDPATNSSIPLTVPARTQA